MKIVDSNTEISKIDFREGAIILIDKPLEWSSFAVVNKIRWTLRHHYNLKKFKVGHAGTLDPLATGLLLVVTGKGTKQINEYMGRPKAYACQVKLGAITASYDAEAEEEQLCSVDHITLPEIEKSVHKFIGEIDQKAPIYSALKVNGQPMYKLARQGKEVEQKVRKIIIEDIQINSFNTPYINLNLRCSKGTYVRSLAHDLGQDLRVGGYLSELRRTEIGEFNIDNALSIESFVNEIKGN